MTWVKISNCNIVKDTISFYILSSIIKFIQNIKDTSLNVTSIKTLALET